MKDSLETVVIVGGGTAGWMTAAAITSALPPGRVSVRLIESEAIGIIGVGEATLPHLRQFNDNIGVDEAAFMRETRATFKLGIEFVNWARQGDRYLHPFGIFGPAGSEPGFHHFWRRAGAAAGDIGDYSLPVVAARLGRFDFPDPDTSTLSGSYGYAYQFDSTLYAPFLRRHAEHRGAQRTEGRVVDALRDAESGDISAVVLEDGQHIEGDLFVDCSGFRGLLIEQSLAAGFEDWSHWLPCDRAVAAQSESSSSLTPYTRATADTAGWRWRIPLQHRTGNGHVYCSEWLDEDKATAALIDGLDGPLLTTPKPLRFATGKRNRMWHHNCVAVGLSGGFLEPLESTSIYLIQAAITNLIELLPAHRDYAAERDEFNRILDLEFERVRDFLILHYHATERDDSPFWNYVRNMPIPESLAEKIALFRARGRVADYSRGLFLEPSWLAVYLGQRVIPEHWDQRADRVNEDALVAKLESVRAAVHRQAASMQEHAAAIVGFCPSPAEHAA